LRRIFAEQLGESVRLRLFTQPPPRLFVPGVEPCASCPEAEELVNELAAVSEKLEVAVHDVKQDPDTGRAYGINGMVPAVVLEPASNTSAGAGPPAGMGRIRFFGLPAGYEFSTLVADILDLSNRRVDLSAAACEELQALTEDVHLQVFVTPT
jgi:alkyl hydroperoxide reductase subunit AhpF